MSFVSWDEPSEQYRRLKRRVKAKAIAYLAGAGRGGYYRYDVLREGDGEVIIWGGGACVPRSGRGSMDVGVQKAVNH